MATVTGHRKRPAAIKIMDAKLVPCEQKNNALNRDDQTLTSFNNSPSIGRIKEDISRQLSISRLVGENYQNRVSDQKLSVIKCLREEIGGLNFLIDARRRYNDELERRLEVIMIEDEIARIKSLTKVQRAYNHKLEHRLNLMIMEDLFEELNNGRDQLQTKRKYNHMLELHLKKVENDRKESFSVLEGNNQDIKVKNAIPEVSNVIGSRQRVEVRDKVAIEKKKTQDQSKRFYEVMEFMKSVKLNTKTAEVVNLMKLRYAVENGKNDQKCKLFQLISNPENKWCKERVNSRAIFSLVQSRLLDETYHNWKKRKKKVTDDYSFYLLEKLVN